MRIFGFVLIFIFVLLEEIGEEEEAEASRRSASSASQWLRSKGARYWYGSHFCGYRARSMARMLRNGVSSMSPWMGGGPPRGWVRKGLGFGGGSVVGEGGGRVVAFAAAVRATLAPRLWPQSTKRVLGDGG